MSDWQGAELSQQLSRLDEQAAQRTRNSAFLDQALSEIEGITPQALDPRCTRNGHYAYIIHYNKATFAGMPIQKFIQAFNAEGIPTQASYPPVHDLAVFQNGEYRKRLSPEAAQEKHAFLYDNFPKSLRGAWETFWLPQPVLLGTQEEMEQVVQAIQKIQLHAKDLV